MASFYGKVEELQRLIAARSYRDAAAILRSQLELEADSVWLRQQLADVLVMDGQRDGAVEVLDTLVDTFLQGGFHQKAIAVVKRMQRLAPGDPANEVRLAAIVRSQEEELGRVRSGGPAAAPGTAAALPISEEAARQAAFRAALRPPTATRYAKTDLTGTTKEAAPPWPTPATQARPHARPATVAPAPPPPLTEVEVALEAFETLAPPAGGALDGLAHSPLFGQFSPGDLLAVVRSLSLNTCEPGEILVTEGEPGNSLHVLVSGSARVYVRASDGSSHQVRTLGEGEFFGEVSLLTGQPRSATVVAATPCELLELDAAAVRALAADHPQVPIVIREICDRRAGSSEERAARAVHPAP